jgi:hypothetical protein
MAGSTNGSVTIGTPRAHKVATVASMLFTLRQLLLVPCCREKRLRLPGRNLNARNI